jgi:hypothetical protein
MTCCVVLLLAASVVPRAEDCSAHLGVKFVQSLRAPRPTLHSPSLVSGHWRAFHDSWVLLERGHDHAESLLLQVKMADHQRRKASSSAVSCYKPPMRVEPRPPNRTSTLRAGRRRKQLRHQPAVASALRRLLRPLIHRTGSRATIIEHCPCGGGQCKRVPLPVVFSVWPTISRHQRRLLPPAS